MCTSVISIGLTLAFLLTLGPVASKLCGILTGEVIILFRLNRMMEEWMARHG